MSFFSSLFKKPTPVDGRMVIARLNAKVQPIARYEIFEDPLSERLGAENAGEVTGGGTQMADEPHGIEYCDLEIVLADDTTNDHLVALLEEIGVPKGSSLIDPESGDVLCTFGTLEGLALFLNGTDLPDEVYAESDVNDLIEEIDTALGGVGEAGELLGHWDGSRETGLYFYGPDFEAMRSTVEGIRARWPLAEKSRIEQIA